MNKFRESLCANQVGKRGDVVKKLERLGLLGAVVEEDTQRTSAYRAGIQSRDHLCFGVSILLGESSCGVEKGIDCTGSIETEAALFCGG